MLKRFSLLKFVISVPILFTFIILVHSYSFAQTRQDTTVSAFVHFDLDHDGIPNWWELQYGLNPTDPTDAALDIDADHLTNIEEYLFNSDPTKRDTDGGNLWDDMERHDEKNPRDPKDDLIPVKYGAAPDPAKDERGDSDGDGLSWKTEEKYGTDDHKIDTDDDGLNDNEELYVYMTSPTDPDTDKDNISDGKEVQVYKTNPKLRDTDFDGLTDYEEIFAYGTNPSIWDTDDGGMSDRDEILNESNPLEKEDDYQFIWAIYYGDKPNDLFKSLENNKIDIYEGVDLTFEALLPVDAKSLTVSYNEKGFSTEKQIINLKLISPDKPGIYTIQIIIELKTGKKITVNRYVEVKKLGQIIRRADGVFNNLYSKIDYFKTQSVHDARIEIYTYNEITKSMELFVSDIFPKANPQYSDLEGRYFLALHPGNYMIRINKPEFGAKEILYNADKYTLFSEDIYLKYNYDPVIWGGLFFLIFILVWQLISMIMQFKDWLSRLSKHKSSEAY